MAYTQADLDMAIRHVAEGEQHIVRQEEVVTRLRLIGQPTEEAEAILDWFNQVLVQHRLHRDLIEADLKRADRERRFE